MKLKKYDKYEEMIPTSSQVAEIFVLQRDINLKILRK